jgi:hypothetical protein
MLFPPTPWLTDDQLVVGCLRGAAVLLQALLPGLAIAFERHGFKAFPHECDLLCEFLRVPPEDTSSCERNRPTIGIATRSTPLVAGLAAWNEVRRIIVGPIVIEMIDL